MGIQLLTGLGITIIISVLLEALELDDDLSLYLTNFFNVVYMLAAVVASKEGLYGFSAAEKAWLIVSEKFYEITVVGAMIFVVQGSLEEAYASARFLPRKKEVVVALVIMEDTAADIFRYSVAAAFLTAILQVFQCLVTLAVYCGGGRPTDRRPLGNDVSGVPAATHAQPLLEAEAARAGSASGGSDASSSAGGPSRSPNTRTARPRRKTRPNPKYDPRVWQLL